MLTTYCCLECSTPDVLVPIHPPSWLHKGTTKVSNCMCNHRDHPSETKRFRPSGKKWKRQRGVEDEEE